jgi:putative ABC transport system permease protein
VNLDNQIRDRWPGAGLADSIVRDFRYALRSLRKDYRFSLVAILALALGIGASTVVFSVVYKAIFETVPYKSFSRLVVLRIDDLAKAGGSTGRAYFSANEVRAIRENNHVFEEIVVYANRRDFYRDGKSGHYLPFGAVVTANAFDFLGVTPLFGRGISPEDSKPDSPRVFVISDQLWRNEFGGDPQILDKKFILNDTVTTLVGVMRPGFEAFGANYWMPAKTSDAQLSLDRGGLITGRLKPGVGLRAATENLNQIAHELQRTGPAGEFPEKFAVVSQTLLDSLLGNFKQTLYALLAAVLLLFLIACSNVANLLLARATSRQREMAMRATMGASRGRLVRQLLIESALLTATASAVGCAVAFFSLKVVVALIPAGTLPGQAAIRLNVPVLLLMLGAAVVTVFLTGLAPALHVVRGDLQSRLTGSNTGTGGSGRHGKLRGSLVISQVAFSVVLLIGAGLLMRSFFVLTRVELGFNPKNLFYFRLDPTMYARSANELERRTRQNALTQRLLDRLRALPSVTSASESVEEPPLNYEWSDTIIPGRPHAERWETRYEVCSEDYFQTLGVPLLHGRLFSGDDVLAQRFVTVVNQAFVRQYFPNENPLGQRVKLQVLDMPYLAAPRDAYFEIVGVVANYKTRGENSWQDFPEIFIPYSIQAFSWRTFMARTSIDATLFLGTVSKVLSELDPDVRIMKSGTVEGELRQYYRGPQFELVTLGAFGFIGLVLVIVGVSSVMAYSVSLRTHEIGVRMAIGAQRSNILNLIVFGGFRLIASGIVLGLAASYGVTRLLASQISGVSTTDPATFAVVAMFVVAAGVAACLIPARQAASVDPLVALRNE